jgi:hypothetical protein
MLALKVTGSPTVEGFGDAVKVVAMIGVIT